METRLKPQDIWQEYAYLAEYLTKNNVYEEVKRNENFYDGRQWEGVKAENMPKPVINIIQRVVKYMIATIGSSKVAVTMVPFTSAPGAYDRMKPISMEAENVIEQARLIEKGALVIRNAAVDGSSYLWLSFDPDFETNQEMKGRIEAQVVDCTNVYFGNPYSNVLQKQPFIIIALRQNIRQVREEAKGLGLSDDDIEMISADNSFEYANDDSSNLVTVLVKLWKKDGRIHFTKTTKSTVLIDDTNLGLRRYPLSCFGWDPRKNSYLYNSPVTPVIQNQIFINKCYAIAQMYGLQSAFPKVVYDKNKIDIKKFLESTSPSAVAGIDMMGKFMDFIKVPDFSNNIIALVQDVIAQTRECMGVNDASLGNVSPENTSAIIALQQASSVPLELQRQAYFSFWEDTVRNIIDLMACSYGTRKVMAEDGTIVSIDFDKLGDLNYQLKVDVGEGAQYSEIAQVNTLDQLFKAGLVDPTDYVEAIPSKYIPSKGKILASLKERQNVMQNNIQNNGNIVQ